MTRARSGKASPVAPATDAQHQDPDKNRRPRNRLAPLISRTGKMQFDAASSLGQLHSDEGIVRAANACRLAVRRRDPARIEILGHHERRSRRSGSAEIDLHPSRLVALDARSESNWRRKAVDALR